MFCRSVVVKCNHDDRAGSRKKFSRSSSLVRITSHPGHVAVIATCQPFTQKVTFGSQSGSGNNAHELETQLAGMLTNLIAQGFGGEIDCRLDTGIFARFVHASQDKRVRIRRPAITAEPSFGEAIRLIDLLQRDADQR